VVQVAVGHFTEIDQTGPHGLPVRSFVAKNAPAGAADGARRTPGQIAWLERQLGRPFPYSTYGVLGVDTFYGGGLGLETATLSTFAAQSLPLPAAPGGQVHELVHQYFGDTVPVRSWDDMWLSEGHATYFQWIYGAQTGRRSLDQIMKEHYAINQDQLDTWGAVAHQQTAAGLISGTDNGGALTLFALRNIVGDATFHRIEQTFYDEFRGRPASTQDYIDVANRVSGQNLDGFFHDWLYTTTTPPMPGHTDWPRK
jgi:aminopeptidase N